jgi:hypothetical protein
LLIQQLPEATKEFSNDRLGSCRIINSGSGSRVVSRPRNHSAAVLFEINFGWNIFKVSCFWFALEQTA